MSQYFACFPAGCSFTFDALSWSAKFFATLGVVWKYCIGPWLCGARHDSDARSHGR